MRSVDIRGAGRRQLVRNLVLGTTGLVGLGTAFPLLADPYVVTDTASLVAAINAANLSAGDDEIILAQDINLTDLLPTITDGITINGGGYVLAGSGNSRIFFIDAPAENVSITNFSSLSGGAAAGGSGGSGLGGGGLGAGGAIFVNAGAVSVSDVTFSANSASGGDGGAYDASGNAGGGGGLGGDGGNSSPTAGGGGGGYSGGGGGAGALISYSYQTGIQTGGPAGAGGFGPGGDGGVGGTGTAGSAGFGNGGLGGNSDSVTSGYSAYGYVPGGSYCYYSFWGGSYCYYYGGYSYTYYVQTGVDQAGGGGGGGAIGGGDGGNGYGTSPGGGGGGGGLTGVGGDGGSGSTSGGAGGNGTFGGGGGGGSGYGTAGSGGIFGGGGGSYGAAGAGGFGGGGGGSQNGTGGAAGFGGGSGGSVFNTTVVGGVGGGTGSSGVNDSTAGGGGGAGLGGAIFVNTGGTLTLGDNVSFGGSGVQGGSAGGSAATGGASAGSDLFLMSGTTTTFSPGAGNQVSLSGTIGDDSSSTLTGTTGTIGNGVGATIAVNGGGTVELAGQSTIAGGFTVDGSTLAVTNTGLIAAPNSAVQLIGAGALLDNAGAIQGGGPGAVIVSADGAVHNSGSIQGSQAGILATAGVEITNSGLVSGIQGAMVLGGGTLSNLAGGQLLGTSTGLTVGTGSLVDVTNAGTIEGDQYGALVDGGLTLSNLSGGLVSGGQVGIYATSLASKLDVTNSGAITGGTAAIASAAGATIDNKSGGLISGPSGAYQSLGLAASTITNAGDMIGGVTSYGGGDLDITNAASGNIVRVIPGSAIDLSNGGKLTLQNSGDIVGSLWGVVGRNSGDSIVNSGRIATGTISGEAITIGGDNAVDLQLGGSLTNLAGGSISGGSTGVIGRGVFTMTNGGAISSATSDAVLTTGQASITNAATGSITGPGIGINSSGSVLSLTNAGSISGSAFGAVYTSGGTNTITNAVGGTITGSNNANALNLRGTSTVVNNGTLSNSNNIYTGLYSPGQLDLTNTGAINGGFDGVYAGTTGSKVDNSGSIIGRSNSGVTLVGSGIVENRAAGSITGVRSGVVVGASSTVNNAGTIIATGTGANDHGVFLNGGNSVLTNVAAATISGNRGVELNGAGSSVINSGTINGTGSGTSGYAVIAFTGGTIDNRAGGLIAGAYRGVYVSGGLGSVTNAGTISAGLDNGVSLFAGGTVTNLDTGSLIAQGTGGWGIYGTGGPLSIDNAGTILADSGIVTNVAGAQVVNTGSITGASNGVWAYSGTLDLTNGGEIVGTAADAVTFTDGGSLINQAGGSIDGERRGIYSAAGLLTIANAGTIAGANHDGITSLGQLDLTNQANATISSGLYSAVAATAGGTVTNGGTLSGGNDADYGFGLQLAGGDFSVTNQAGGVIGGGAGSILINGDGNSTIQLDAGSLATGALRVLGAGLHTTNIAGALNGLYDASASSGIDNVTLDANGSVAGLSLGAGDDSLVVRGGTLSNVADGGADTDSLLFDIASGSVTFGADQFTGFESRAKDGAGTLTLTGTDGMTIDFLVNGGTLAVSGGSAINDSAAVLLASGSTLQLLSSEAIRALSGAGMVDVGANALVLAGDDSTTFSGVMSGSGSLVKRGTGSLTLTGANSFTGGLLIEGGSVDLGAADVLSDATPVGVASGATLAIGANNETVGSLQLAGTLAGTGTLTAATYTLLGGVVDANLGAGTLIQQSGISLLNGTAAADLVQLAGGTLKLGAANRLSDSAAVEFTGPATLDLNSFDETVSSLAGGGGTIALGAGRLTLDQSINTIFSGSITGSGGLTKSGSGALNLTGASSYSGTTYVTNGLLAVNGSLASAVDVASGGRIGGNGTIGGLLLNSGAILAPGNSIGHLTVAGNLTFAAGSIYQVETTPTSADRTTATGNIVINGGTVEVLAGGTAYSPLTNYIILDAGGTVAGTFTDVTSNLAFLDPTLIYSPQTVALQLRRNDIVFADVAATPNQEAVADAVQSIGSGTLYDAVLVQSAGGAQAAFNALSGEVYASTPVIVADQGNRLIAAMRNADRRRSSGVELWADIGRAASLFDGSDGVAGVNGDERSLLAGIGFRNNGLSVSAGGGIANTDLNVSRRDSKADIDSSLIGVQLGYRGGAIKATASATHAWHDIDTSRAIRFPGFAEEASSSRKGRTTQLHGEVAFVISPMRGVVVEPFVSALHQRTKVDATVEDGGVSALSLRGESFRTTAATLGTRFETSFSALGGIVTPRTSVGWRHLMGDRDGRLHASFDGSDEFRVSGIRRSAEAALIEVGADLDLGKLRIGVNYDGKLANTEDSHSISGNLTFRF